MLACRQSFERIRFVSLRSDSDEPIRLTQFSLIVNLTPPVASMGHLKGSPMWSGAYISSHRLPGFELLKACDAMARLHWQTKPPSTKFNKHRMRPLPGERNNESWNRNHSQLWVPPNYTCTCSRWLRSALDTYRRRNFIVQVSQLSGSRVIQSVQVWRSDKLRNHLGLSLTS